MKNLLRGAVVAAPLLALGVLAPPASADLASEVQDLRVAAEQGSDNYNKDALNINYDRDEILANNESTFDSCDGYFSRYDGQCHTSEGDVHIDHLVALKEAWDSGLRGEQAWERFDGDAANLVVMTEALNLDKSARDAAEWAPKAATCHYVQAYVDIKAKYDLTVDQDEKQALLRLAANCGNGGNNGNQDGGNNNGGGNQGGGNGGNGGGGGIDAGKFNCPDFQHQEAAQAVFNRHEDDVFRLDDNDDGVACESLPHKPTSGGDDTQNGGQQDTTPPGNGDEENGTPDGNDQVSAIPDGGVQTGGGGTAGTPTGLWVLLATLLLGTASALGLRMHRQRQ